MRKRLIHIFVLIIFLLCHPSICLTTEASDPNQSSKYLDAVRIFADNVLEYGRDEVGDVNTPFFYDGLNVNKLEPVKWISPKGGNPLTATETEEWILSNFASQQTLLRTLVGLSKIAGDPKYHNAATQVVKYAFENLRSDNGLFYWGNAAAYDVQADKPYSYNGHHTIKTDYPYYELMWQVDARATREVIEAFWSALILDWSNLDMNRYGFLLDSIEAPWNYEYKRGPVPFKGKGHGFFTTGTSLAHAAALLSRLSGQEEPLVWSKRLTQRYVDTRDPKIGISAYAFNYSSFMCRTFPVLPFKYRYLDYPEERHVHPWLSVLLIGQMLGEKGNEFTQWALEELTAWGKVSYRRKDNSFVPMIIDGTNLEGYVLEEGPIGLNIAKPCPAGPQYFWAFCVAYHETGDEFMWQMVRDIALGNDFGDIGQSPGEIPKLKTKTTCSHVYGLLGFLQLYEKTNNRVYLEMARRIGDNILINKFHKGFFVPSKRHIYTRFDCFEPLALLHLEAAIKPTSKSIPTVWPSLSLFRPAYRYRQEGVDRLIIYTLTESSKPPLSLQEAVAIGDFKLVKTLLEGGTDVNVLDDTFFKTALHRAAISGHKEIAEFLLAKGASIDARSSASDTTLHYAVEQGHTKIVELLIANDVDVNAENNNGQTPLHKAAIRGLKDIAELLIANEADINAENNNGQTPLHKAAIRGHKDVAELLIDNGADVNATSQVGYTPLHYAVWSWDTETAELLIEKGADVNAKNRWGWTPLHYAANGDNRGMAYLLIVKGGADVNAKNNSGETALSVAKEKGHTEIVELLRRQSVNDLVKSGSVNVKDKDGRTPLHHAAESGLDGLVRELIVNNADVNATDIYGRTPLHSAAHKGHKNVAECLLTQGGYIDASDNAGRTPLHYAVGAGKNRAPDAGHIEVVRLFIDKGVKINTKDKLGWTPLHYAVRMANKAMVELLVNSGADSNVTDNRGRTAFSLARRCFSLFRNILESEISDWYRKRLADLPSRYSEIIELLPQCGGVFYVAADGKDSNSGTIGSPFRTLGVAIDAAKPDDTIFVRGGIYSCSNTIYIDKSGEQGKPICLRAYPGEAPVFDFSVAKAYGFIIKRAYWHIKGLTVTGAELTGIRLETKEAHHNILEHIKAYANGLKGIDLQSGSSHNLVLNCDSYQNFDPETDGENADGFAAVSGLGKGNILIGCRAWNNSDDGFDLWDAGNSVRLENCYSYRNGQNIWSHPFFTGNANGFKLGLGLGGHVLIGCVAFDHGFGGFNLNGNETGVILYGCTAFKNSPNYRFPDQDRGIDNCILRNNISAQGKTRDGIGIKADSQFNSWNAVLNLNVAVEDFLSLDDGVMTQARNQDGSIPESDFLRLAPGSDAIDAGADVGLPFIGKAPDLGAFEHNPAENGKHGPKMLHQAVRDYDVEKIHKMLAEGTDVNEKDWLGYAPLHWAIYFGYPDVAELLLDRGANPNLVSDTGRTPLEIAKTMDYEQIVELMCKHGAKE